jgi:adenosylcobinamide-GDP ribazoletransferase
MQAPPPWEAGLFAALAAALVAPVLAPLRALPAFVAVLGLKGLCERRLGGVTGDCLGAAIELAELLFLLAAVL